MFSASANANSVSLAEGDDSLSLNRGLTGSTVVAAGGADTVVAALTVAGSSIAAGGGADSVSISVLSNSTITGASGADTITIAGDYLTAQVYGNQGADSVLVGGTATSGSIFGGKGNDVLSVAGNVVGGNVEGNSAQIRSRSPVRQRALMLVVCNDTISLAAVDGGNVGGQLGADTMVVGGVLKNATVSMTNAGDPENSADLADSLTAGSCPRTAPCMPVPA